MKSLIESILSSTNTGAAAIKNVETLKLYAPKKYAFDQPITFKKSSVKDTYVGKCKKAKYYFNGKDGYDGLYNNEITVAITPFDVDGIIYYDVYVKVFNKDNWKTTAQAWNILNDLSAVQEYLEWVVKPNKTKTVSKIGNDGEIHLGYVSMSKGLPSSIKSKVVTSKKELEFLYAHADFDKITKYVKTKLYDEYM